MNSNSKLPELITVKIGSNVLTRSDGTLDITRMSSIVDQIVRLRQAGIRVIIITSGAVACGRAELRDAELHSLDHVAQRQLFSAVGQTKLLNHYYQLFREYGYHVGQVLTNKESFSTRRHYLNQRSCISTMLQNNIIPVINENDTISLTELMFTDNDELSGIIASMLHCDTLIILSNIDGIYDGNPNDVQSQVIRTVRTQDDLTTFIQSGTSSLGRGGMATKYSIAHKLASQNIRVIIANGRQPDILPRIIFTPQETVSTTFEPSDNPVTPTKLWIAHSHSFTKGEITVDQGAAAAITSQTATSLLPVGIIEVSGSFEKDDLVNIFDPNHQHIAIGRAAYSAEDIRQSIGLRNHPAVIKTDYLYVIPRITNS